MVSSIRPSGEWAGEKEIAPVVDLVYSPGINDFQGKKDLQLFIVEVIGTDEKSVTLKSGERERTGTGRKRLQFEIIDMQDWKGQGKELPVYSDAVYFMKDWKPLMIKK